MNKLAIVTTHPIQYYAPLFQCIAAEDNVYLKVFYSRLSDETQFDPDFGRDVVWDIPLTQGYDHDSFQCSNTNGILNMIHSIREFDASALMVFGWNFPGHLKVIRHFSGNIPIWFRGDSTLLDNFPWWKRTVRRLWLTYVYKHVDLAFFVGHANKRYFLWSGLREEQLSHAPHAIDNDYFMRAHDTRVSRARKLREQLNIATEAKVILYVGKLEPKKQPLELATAFMKMQKEHPLLDAHLVFVGSGVLESALTELSESESRIHLLGFVNQSEMPETYRIGDFVCLPSKGPGETWGLVINEGIASGLLPIVTDRVGCGEDLVTDKDAIMPADSPELWPEMIARILSKTISPEDIASAQDRLGKYEDFIAATNWAFKEKMPSKPKKA